MDKTDFSGSTYSYSQKLTGGSNSQVGVAKNMKVYPGDKVKIEAYAKYYNATGTTSNLSGFALALTGAFGVTSSSTGEALKAYNSLNTYGGVIAGGSGGGSGSHPKLFVNILLFDKNYNFLDASWQQIDGGEQVGASPKADHDYISSEVTVKEEGFAYVYVSNENPTLIEFYVDDVAVTYTPSNVIQYNEYYPFGLQTASSWTRENTTGNNYLYNAANELNKDNGWYEMHYRGYDPATGRMLQIDPYAPMYASATTYNYSLNNPVMMNDPNGGQVSAQGHSDYQLRSLYRVDRSRGYSGSFGQWAVDNIDDLEFFDGPMTGTHGEEYGTNENGRFGKWVLADTYDVGFYSISQDGERTWTPTGEILDVYKLQEIDDALVIMGLDGNISRFDKGANLIYVDMGNGTLKPFSDRLVIDGKMKVQAFSNGLLSILNGMKLPKGQFEASKLYNGEISVALFKNGITYNGGILKAGLSNYQVPMPDGSHKIVYQHINGLSLTVQSIQTSLGIHEYYAHGMLGYPDETEFPQYKPLIDALVAGYPYK